MKKRYNYFIIILILILLIIIIFNSKLIKNEKIDEEKLKFIKLPENFEINIFAWK